MFEKNGDVPYSDAEKKKAIANAAGKKRKKLNREFFTFDESENKSFFGKVKGFDKGFSRTYDAEFVILIAEDESGETVQMVMDGGLRGALKMAKVIEGDTPQDRKEKTIDITALKVAQPDLKIEIEFSGTKELATGDECNVYNIYEVE